MTLKQLILIVLAATVICWLSWLLVIFEVDPATGGLVGFATFYISLFFSFLGLFFLTVLIVRKLSKKDELEYRIVGSSFRQSFFFALIVIGALFLQSQHFLTWWNIIFLVLAIAALEYFVLSYKKSPPDDSSDYPPSQGFIPPDF